jgi:uncharacterized protein YggE
MKVLGFVLALVAVLAVAVAPAAAQEPRTISVSGDSSLDVRNDTATVTLAAAARARDAGTALRRSSARMRRVIRALTEIGIDRGDIQTLDVDVQRVTERRGDRRVRLYEATNRIRVTVVQVRRTGRVIDAAVRAGATDVSRLSFSRSNARELYLQQLVAAFDNARVKAERLAERAGMTLGDPLEITESSFRDSVRSTGGSDEFSLEAAGSAPVRPGRTTIEARVFVVFEAT